MKQTQQVIDMLENSIFQTDFEKAAKITGIPLGLYQRLFSYICGISMTEYIRRRKLTESAKMLLEEKVNVTEASLCCGYENSASYTRAFKELFLVPPVQLTAEIYHRKAFHPLSFTDKDTYYVMKGRRIMAELVKIEYENTEDLLLIGISNHDYPVTGNKELWDIFWSRHFDDKLNALMEYQVGMEDCIGLGYATDFTSEEGLGDTYIIGKFFQPDTPVPEGMTGRLIKGRTIAKAQIGAKSFDDILNNAYLLMSDMVQKNGYELDYENFYWIEFYTVSRFCTPLETGQEQIICDWIMPCKKN